jgi:phage baseplate assembly protein W
MPTRKTDAYTRDLLGNGIITPMRRVAGSDFVTGNGETLVRSSVRQIMGTKPGELRWRPDFGMDLERYRHRGATKALSQQLSNEISSGLTRWEPRLAELEVLADVNDNVINVKLLWDTASAISDNNAVKLGPVQQEVEV